MDLIEKKVEIDLIPELREELVKQIKSDSDFLAAHNINDYSLLLGIHPIGIEDESKREVWQKEAEAYASNIDKLSEQVQRANPFFTVGNILFILLLAQ